MGGRGQTVSDSSALCAKTCSHLSEGVRTSNERRLEAARLKFTAFLVQNASPSAVCSSAGTRRREFLTEKCKLWKIQSLPLESQF